MENEIKASVKAATEEAISQALSSASLAEGENDGRKIIIITPVVVVVAGNAIFNAAQSVAQAVDA